MRDPHGESTLTTVRRIMNIRAGMLALAIAAAIGWSSAASADTAVATRWRLVGEAQDNCMNRAVAAIRHSGFDQGPPGSQSISGKKGDYTASIRCVSDQNIVFFVTSGPAADTASSYLNVLYGNF
jgi:hypothetical protein